MLKNEKGKKPQVVGMIGLGYMGSAMSTNLLRDGCVVVGYDIVSEKVNNLRKKGGKILSSSQEVAKEAQMVITSLPSSSAFEDVIWGKQGILASCHEGLIVIECSTLPINEKQKAKKALEEAGMILLDCPISGGTRAVEKDLVVYGSGDRSAFDKCVPIFNGFARSNYYLGEFGNGSKMKFVTNLLVAIHNTAAAEAFLLGMKSGLNPEMIYNVVKDSAGRSRMFEVRGPKMVKAEYDNPTMKVGIFKKDLEVISNFAAALNCPTPLFSDCVQLYWAALAQGREDQDTSSVCAVLEEMARFKRQE